MARTNKTTKSPKCLACGSKEVVFRLWGELVVVGHVCQPCADKHAHDTWQAHCGWERIPAVVAV